MSKYDTVAKFYDKVLGRTDSTVRYVRNRIRTYNPGAKSILEIGCGTGKNLSGLGKYYSVSGLDNSIKMLEAASEKNPEANLYRMDMRTFALSVRFDVILCLYDTINHLTSFSDWRKVFANVSRHLKTNGLFIFDINTLYKLNNISNAAPLIHEFDRNFLLINVSKISTHTFNWSLKIFEHVRNMNYKLIQTNIKEAGFETAEIKKALIRHFDVLKMEDEEFNKPKKSTGRIYFVCRKKQ